MDDFGTEHHLPIPDEIRESSQPIWQSEPPRKIKLTRVRVLERLAQTREALLAEDGNLKPKPLAPTPVKGTHQRLNRREFLKYSAAVGTAGAVAGAAALGIKPWEWMDVLRALGSAPPSPPPAAPPEISNASDATVDQSARSDILPQKTTTFELVFEDLPEDKRETVRETVEALRQHFSKNLAYGAPFAVAKKWESMIRENARRVGFPEELALGMVLIENGGGEREVSNAGARGVSQLMPDTARSYGLVVNNKVDERTEPAKSIPVMCDYIKDNLGRFAGNLGLAVWSYHAGETNVYNALREYFIDKGLPDLGQIAAKTYPEGVAKMENYKRLIGENKANVFDVLTNPRVQRKVLSTLGGETELYTYKAVAAASFFESKAGPSAATLP